MTRLPWMGSYAQGFLIAALAAATGALGAGCATGSPHHGAGRIPPNFENIDSTWSRKRFEPPQSLMGDVVGRSAIPLPGRIGRGPWRPPPLGVMLRGGGPFSGRRW